MTLDRPLWLLALLAVPVLYLLARNLRQRRAVPVSSLLIWRRLGLAAEPPRDLARRSDRLLLLRMAATGLTALGLAGPVLAPGVPEPVVDVLIDGSLSMRAFRDAVEVSLDDLRRGLPRKTGLRITRSTVDSGLPALLARPGAGDVVIVTDHAPPGIDGEGRVRLVLVGGPVENVGITSAWLREGRYGAVVTSFGSIPRDITVHHPEGELDLTLEPGESQVVEGGASEDAVEIRITPGDAFEFDDRVVLGITPAVTLRLAWHGPKESALRLAFETAGVLFDAEAPDGLYYRTPAKDDARVIVAPPGPARDVDSGSVAASGGFPAEACPPPGLPLGRSAVLETGGCVLLADRGGPLAVNEGDVVTLALDPADPASRLSRDPSFPVLVFELVRLLGARGPGFELREGVIDPVESATRPVSHTPVLTNLVSGRAGEVDPGFGLAGILFVVAGLLLLLHFALEAGWRVTLSS